MNRYHRLTFTEPQKIRIELMRRVAQAITETTGTQFALKGGTALLLAYGLPRYSTDLDFDGKDNHVDIEKALRIGTERAGVKIEDLILKKNTPTTKRYMLHYEGSVNKPLKVEFSYRQAGTIDENDIVVADGIRVYTIEKLAELKILAFIGRMQARDAFDVAFLLENYSEAISDHCLAQISKRVGELTLDGIASAMREDEVLGFSDIDNVVLKMDERVKERLRIAETAREELGGLEMRM
jgi:predicted nucleotidyltransferase component of viral defense system